MLHNVFIWCYWVLTVIVVNSVSFTLLNQSIHQFCTRVVKVRSEHNSIYINGQIWQDLQLHNNVLLHCWVVGFPVLGKIK